MASRTVSDSERICITYLFPLTVHRCASSLACPAHRSYRALWASRFSRHTNQGSQLHGGLVEFPGAFPVAGHQSTRQLPDPRCTLHVARCTIEEHAPEHAIDVRIYSWHWLLVSKCRDGSCCVWTNARELDELFRCVGQLAVVILTDHARKRVEIGSPRVVSQPIPSLTHRAGPRPRQRLEIRKALEESRIVLRHAAHLRLLQHELGHEHAVRIARAPPWQVARGAGPPGEELAGELGPHPRTHF